MCGNAVRNITSWVHRFLLFIGKEGTVIGVD